MAHTIALTADEQRAVNADRDGHPDPLVRRKMPFLWSCHCRVTREAAGRVAGVSRATAERYVAAYRDGGLDGLDGLRRRARPAHPPGGLAPQAAEIKADLLARPVRTTAEAIDRIEALTGVRRGPTRTREFPADLAWTWQRARAVPVPPKKTRPAKPA